jgi:hypothetical protein
MIDFKLSVENDIMSAKTPYYKIKYLYTVLDALQSETDMLDYPEIDRAIGKLRDETEDWLEEHKPSEDEEEAREILGW